MRLITRYLLKELGVPFLLGVVLFTFVLLFGKFLKLTDLVVNQGVGIINLVTFVLLGIPETFSLIVPMAMVLATLMAYGRLAGDNEIMILRLAGYPMYALLLPTLITGLLLSVSLVGFTEYVAPTLSQYRAQKMKEMKQPNPVSLMKPRSYQQFGPFTIYAETVNGPRMTGVYIEDHSGKTTRIILGETGRWSKSNGGFELTLRNGTVHQAGKKTSQYRTLQFQTQTIQFQPETSEANVDEPVRSVTSLWNRYRGAWEKFSNLKTQTGKTGSETIKHARQTYIKSGIAFHRALAFPFACFFLVLLAAPIGMLSQQEGKSMGFSVSLGIIFVYYVIMTFAEPLAMNHWLSPAIAMWSANLLFGAIGVGLFTWVAVKR